MKYLILSFLLLPFLAFRQNVGFGTDNQHTSAKLEVQSTSGGVLIPRLTNSERDLIPTPVSGLLKFNSENNRFEFFNGN